MVCALCALLWPHYNPSHVICETAPFCSFTYSCGDYSSRTINRPDRRGDRSRRLADCALRDQKTSCSQRGALSRQELRVLALPRRGANGRHRRRYRKLPGNRDKQLATERVCVVATLEDRARDWRPRT